MSIPAGATHKDMMLCHEFLKKSANGWEFWNENEEKWLKFPTYKAGTLTVELQQPKPWSGPEDGLPPVGTVCEYRLAPSDVWHECEIRYHMKPAHDDSPRAIVWNEFLRFDQISGSNWHFRAIPTPAQQRETAIRELMDIAQVDCRVTAARLVDAGFKREVV